MVSLAWVPLEPVVYIAVHAALALLSSLMMHAQHLKYHITSDNKHHLADISKVLTGMRQRAEFEWKRASPGCVPTGAALTTYYLLLTTYYLLLTTYYLLITFYLLLTTYYLQALSGVCTHGRLRKSTGRASWRRTVPTALLLWLLRTPPTQ